MRERCVVVASGEEVRAILAGTKTRFHCPMKPQPMLHECGFDKDRRMLWSPHPPGGQTSDRQTWARWSPFGVVGDRLWVKEAWRVETDGPGAVWIRYRSDMACVSTTHVSHDDAVRHGDPVNGPMWRSSPTMPRWACRKVLEVTSVVARPAEDITEEEIVAAGITVDVAAKITGIPWSSLPTLHDGWRAYWDYRFGKTVPWSSEPWEFAATVKAVDAEEKR